MSKIAEQTEKASKGVSLKALILVAFIIAAICLVHFTPLKGLLTPAAVGSLIETSGFWAPLVYILIYAASICFFLPASIPTLLGATIFGAYWGFLYAWFGAMAGACAAFFVGRTLGRDFAESLIGDRLRKYDDAVERNGFAAVLYLRLLNTPFTYLNFGMSLTRVRFWDFFFGTGIGVITGIFILTFLGETLKEVWASGHWREIASLKAVFAVSLFFVSFLIPKIIKKIKKEI
jgi:uncharacterized membrane protein YdjX (TVP38/TMEM64 family)